MEQNYDQCWSIVPAIAIDKNNHASMARVVLLLNGEVGMEVVIKPRESFNLCSQYGSFMKTAESNYGVPAINFKVFENKKTVEL